jgi:LmbE family N-acetylglucosaminyl deacetylase
MDMTQHIFLSPHLDDAVLSCGGMMYQLSRAGQLVQAITIFAGDAPPGPLSPFARGLHDRWQADPATRRAEDVEALALLGAEAIHWPFADAIYRRDPLTGAAPYDSEESIFGEIAPADAALIDAIAARLQALEPSARLIAPLAAGHHVDHQIVRTAAESLERELLYYEDYPYVENPDKLEAVLQPGGWTPEIIRLRDEAIRAKAAATLAYRSQISAFFKSVDDVGQRIRAYALRVGGGAEPVERLWQADQG